MCLARIGTSPIVLVLVLDFFRRGKRAELPTTFKDENEDDDEDEDDWGSTYTGLNTYSCLQLLGSKAAR